MSFGPLNASNIQQFNGQIDQLIKQILQTESQPTRQLKERKASVQKQKEIFDQAASTLTNLQGKAESLGGSSFDQRTATSSNPNLIEVSAGPRARPGTYELTVERLAKPHTLASHRIPSVGTNLAQLFGTGEKSFNIIVGGKRVQVKFRIPEKMAETGKAPSNEDVLRLISQAIRRAGASLGSAGFSSDVLRDTTKTAKLILKSNLTGSSNQLFLEDPQGVLRVLGLNPNQKAGELTGGYIYGPEAQNKLREGALDLLAPIADLSAENAPEVASALGSLANIAAQLSDGEGLPLAQSLSKVARILTDPNDLSENPELELAFEGIADLVDRLDDQAVEALAREFLRRAGELRGPTNRTTRPTSGQPAEPLPGTNPALAEAFETLAIGIQFLGEGQDIDPAFEDFRIALENLSTQDRAELLQQFQAALQGIDALGRKEGDELTDTFVRMVRPLFDLTVDERSSVAVQFLNIADMVDTLGTDSARGVANEFRSLSDLVEGMSQPISDPLETPYASLYAVFYVLPQTTKDKLAFELNSFADQLANAGKGDIGEVFRTMSAAVADPNIEANFDHHFQEFATALGSLNLDDRHEVSRELGSFTDQMRRLLPADQAQLLTANLAMVNHSISEMNQFQRVAFEDQMIAITEALDELPTDERSRIREEMLKSLGHLRTLFPIELPKEAENIFAAFNGAANDLGEDDRNILAAELARQASVAAPLAPDVANALDSLSRATFFANQPGSFDVHKKEFLWFLGSLNDQERRDLVGQIKDVADRLPGLIGEDSIPLVPVLRQMATTMGQPVVFKTTAADFLSALDGASKAVGTFNDDELEAINQSLPELAEALSRNVSDRKQELAQNLFQAGHALSQINPSAQGVLQDVLSQLVERLNGKLSGPDGQQVQQKLQTLADLLKSQETFDSLDAKFTVDGVPITRDSNTVSDLLEGVTLEINDLTPAGQPVRIAIDNDVEGMMKGIQEFVDAYNQAVDFVEKETNVDGETLERGSLAGEQNYLRLRLDLRRAINDGIGIEGGTAFLKELGLGVGTGVNDTNHLRISDEAALRQALTENPNLVKELLGHPRNGAAQRVADLVDEYLRPRGIIDRDKSLLEKSTGRLDDRLGVLNTRLTSREDQLRTEFNGLAEQLIALGSQTQALQGLGLGLTGMTF